MSKIVFGILFFVLAATVFADSNNTIKDTIQDSTKVTISRRDIEKMPVVNVTVGFESSAIKYGEMIPKKYTCDGENISPPIKIEEISNVFKSIAIVCYDPDAPGGDWVHWIIYNIPPEIKELPENIEKTIRPDLGLGKISIQPIQGSNDFGKIGYGGPCSPIGRAHRYFFRLYALYEVLEFDDAEIQKGITRGMLFKAMGGRVESVLMGRYERYMNY